MVEVAGRGEDDIAAVKTVAVVVEELSLIEAAYGCLVPRMGQPSGWSFQKPWVKSSWTSTSGLSSSILISSRITPRSRSISVAAKSGIEHQVGENIEGDGDVVGQRLDVEADGLFAGESVKVAADGVHFAGDVLGGAGASALEEHVLDEVGDAVGFGGLAAGAGLDPYAHGN